MIRGAVVAREMLDANMPSSDGNMFGVPMDRHPLPDTTTSLPAGRGALVAISAGTPSVASAADAFSAPLGNALVFDWPVTGITLLVGGLLLALLIALGLLLRMLGRVRSLRDALQEARRDRGRLRLRLLRDRERLGRSSAEQGRLRAERRRWLRALRRARADLTRQGELLATLGHEVRSPLRSLLAVVDLVRPDADDEDARTQLDVIGDLARHVLLVADDSLELARLERGETRLSSAPFALERELDRVLKTVRLPTDGSVRLGIDFEPGMPLTWVGDAHRIRQMLINLLCNALDHTETGDVTLSFSGGRRPPADRAGRALADQDAPCAALRIVVRDSGTGIAPEERTRIFLPFVQGQRSGGRAGLGLAVVARLASLMNGHVRLDSEVGLGSRFELRLPLAVAAHDFPAPRLDGQTIGVCSNQLVERHAVAGYLLHWGADVEEFDDPAELEARLAGRDRLDAVVLTQREPLLTRFDPPHPGQSPLRLVVADAGVGAQTLWPSALAGALQAGARTPLAAPGAGARGSSAARARLRVLVVDDHPVARRVLSRLLSELDCSVLAAEDGISALEIAEDPEEAFDWVLLDRQMPGLDGLTTATALRSRPATRDARLVLLVNDEGEHHPEARLVDTLLVRPEGMPALRDALAGLLSAPVSGLRNRGRDADLEQIRDETLTEDLEGVERALGSGDRDAAEAHLHRMRGALRLCPETTRQEALEALERSLEDDAANRALADFERLLARDPV